MCLRCLTVFDNEDDCKNHTNTYDAQTTIEYAQPGERVGFQKVRSLYFHPFIAFLDFESFNKKLDSNNDPHQIATQHPFAYKYILVQGWPNRGSRATCGSLTFNMWLVEDFVKVEI